MHNKFVIVGPARTGSSFLTDSLASCPNVLMHGEPFQKENIDWHINERLRNKSFFDLAQRERDPISFIYKLLDFNAGCTHVGCKIFYSHNDCALNTVCHDPDIQKVFLRRKNLLANFASYLLAEQTQIWNEREKIDFGQLKLRFDRQQFEDYLSWDNQNSRTIEMIARTNRKKWLFVYYRPENMADLLVEVAEFLEIDSKDMSFSNFIRLHSGQTLNKFSNKSDVIQTLSYLGKLHWCEEY